MVHSIAILHNTISNILKYCVLRTSLPTLPSLLSTPFVFPLTPFITSPPLLSLPPLLLTLPSLSSSPSLSPLLSPPPLPPPFPLTLEESKARRRVFPLMRNISKALLLSIYLRWWISTTSECSHDNRVVSSSEGRNLVMLGSSNGSSPTK